MVVNGVPQLDQNVVIDMCLLSLNVVVINGVPQLDQDVDIKTSSSMCVVCSLAIGFFETRAARVLFSSVVGLPE